MSVRCRLGLTRLPQQDGPAEDRPAPEHGHAESLHVETRLLFSWTEPSIGVPIRINLSGSAQKAACVCGETLSGKGSRQAAAAPYMHFSSNRKS